jgi:tripartite-type tricarboxylate transporter receptor subunit TctC
MDGWRIPYINAFCVGVIACFGSMCLPVDASAQQYPTRPIKLIVPFPPGGPADIFARPLSEKLSIALKQPVIIENKSGATGTIGAGLVANALPDGYTLLLGTSNEITMSPSLYKNLPYDPNKAFEPITTVATFPNVLVVNADFKTKNLSEFINLARDESGKLSFASSGIGSTNDLTIVLFSSKAKVEVNRIQYKGGGPAIVDLLGGHVDALFATLPSAISQIQSGKLKALAVTGDARMPVLPDVPSFKEFGLGDVRVVAWNGVLAPANTPPEIIQLLYREINKVLLDPDFRSKVIGVGADPVSMPSSEFKALIRQDYQIWSNLIKANRIFLD